MKTTTTTDSSSGKSASKGDRLKWTPLTEVHSVPLTEENTKGRHLTSKELSQGKESEKSKLLVP